MDTYRAKLYDADDKYVTTLAVPLKNGDPYDVVFFGGLTYVRSQVVENDARRYDAALVYAATNDSVVEP